MNLRGWVAVAVVVLVVAVVLWRPSGATARVPSEVGRLRARDQLRRLVEVWGVPAVVVPVVWWWVGSVELALAVGVVVWGCVVLWRAGQQIRRSVSMVSSLAGFATVLAGQARTADTVEDAVREAGSLVSGPAAEAAGELGRSVSRRGIVAAAGTFVRTVNVPAAAWLGLIVVKASAGGGRWADAVRILRSETVHEAGILRELRKQVAAKMPATMFLLLAGAGSVAIAGWLYPDVGGWIAGPGARIVLLAAVIASLNASRVAGAATAFLRS